MDSFCDDNNLDFFHLQGLLSSFTKIDHVANVAELTQKENMLHVQILENRVLQNINRKDPRMMMLVWCTRSSYSLAPFSSDFVDYLKSDILVKDVTKVNRVIGIGTTIPKFIKRKGQDIFSPCISYHLTQTYICLFSPQTYNQMHGGNYVV